MLYQSLVSSDDIVLMVGYETNRSAYLLAAGKTKSKPTVPNSLLLGSTSYRFYYLLVEPLAGNQCFPLYRLVT